MPGEVQQRIDEPCAYCASDHAIVREFHPYFAASCEKCGARGPLATSAELAGIKYMQHLRLTVPRSSFKDVTLANTNDYMAVAAELFSPDGRRFLTVEWHPHVVLRELLTVTAKLRVQYPVAIDDSI